LTQLAFIRQSNAAEEGKYVENQMVMHVWLWLIEVAKNLSCVELIF